MKLVRRLKSQSSKNDYFGTGVEAERVILLLCRSFIVLPSSLGVTPSPL